MPLITSVESLLVGIVWARVLLEIAHPILVRVLIGIADAMSAFEVVGHPVAVRVRGAARPGSRWPDRCSRCRRSPGNPRCPDRHSMRGRVGKVTVVLVEAGQQSVGRQSDEQEGHRILSTSPAVRAKVGGHIAGDGKGCVAAGYRRIVNRLTVIVTEPGVGEADKIAHLVVKGVRPVIVRRGGIHQGARSIGRDHAMGRPADKGGGIGIQISLAVPCRW